MAITGSRARPRTTSRRAARIGLLALAALLPAGAVVAAGLPAAAEHCAYCHGEDGNVTSLNVPRLAGQPAAYLARQLRAYRDARRPDSGTMGPAINGLSDRDIDSVAAYFAAQPIVADRGGTSEINALGAALYNRGKPGMVACIACHVPRSYRVPFDYPRLLGQNGFYLRDQLKAYRDGRRRTDQFAVMRDIARRLSDAELEAVSDYAAHAHP